LQGRRLEFSELVTWIFEALGMVFRGF